MALLSSNSFAIHLLRKSPQFRDDVTFPLLVSVFTAGLTQGLMCVMISVISWFRLQWINILLTIAHFLQLVSILASYISLTTISAIKLFSVLKPFVFRSFFTTCKTSVATILIWILCVSVVAPIFFVPDLVTFRPVSQTPIFAFKGNIIPVVVNKVAVPSMFVIVSLLVLSNLALFIIAVKQAIRINLMKRPTEGAQSEGNGHLRNQGYMTRAVIAALWSAKGVMVLSLLKLTVHLPFFIKLRDTSDDVFYIHWIYVSSPFLDVICFIGCSKTLRQLSMLKCKCCIKQVQPSSDQA